MSKKTPKSPAAAATPTAKSKWMPMRTFNDCNSWLEKAQNEMKETPTSIAQGKARVACVNALKGLLGVAINYQKLTGVPAKIKELDAFVHVDAQAKPLLTQQPPV